MISKITRTLVAIALTAPVLSEVTSSSLAQKLGNCACKAEYKLTEDFYYQDTLPGQTIHGCMDWGEGSYGECVIEGTDLPEEELHCWSRKRNDGRRWRTCDADDTRRVLDDPCECMDTWHFSGDEWHHGCHTPSWGGKPICRPKGRGACVSAKMDSMTLKFWKFCDEETRQEDAKALADFKANTVAPTPWPTPGPAKMKKQLEEIEYKCVEEICYDKTLEEHNIDICTYDFIYYCRGCPECGGMPEEDVTNDADDDEDALRCDEEICFDDEYLKDIDICTDDDFSFDCGGCPQCTETEEPTKRTPEVDLGGVIVLDGGNGFFPQHTCVPATATELEGVRIAAQCCLKNACRRWEGKNNEEGCMVGTGRAENSFEEAITATTFKEAEALCASKGFELCDGETNCRDKGCRYNNHPVWTSQRCQLADDDVPVFVGTLAPVQQPTPDPVKEDKCSTRVNSSGKVVATGQGQCKKMDGCSWNDGKCQEASEDIAEAPKNTCSNHPKKKKKKCGKNCCKDRVECKWSNKKKTCSMRS